jgi:Na+-transporting methylmalonyl-CoA/oxaloacetate decarboxylase gamma subunit
MSVHEMVGEALKMMGIGVGMVFGVLAIFYGLVMALMMLFPATEANKDD